jgi:hypothetical protein
MGAPVGWRSARLELILTLQPGWRDARDGLKKPLGSTIFCFYGQRACGVHLVGGPAEWCGRKCCLWKLDKARVLRDAAITAV